MVLPGAQTCTLDLSWVALGVFLNHSVPQFPQPGGGVIISPMACLRGWKNSKRRAWHGHLGLSEGSVDIVALAFVVSRGVWHFYPVPAPSLSYFEVLPLAPQGVDLWDVLGYSGAGGIRAGVTGLRNGLVPSPHYPITSC